MSLLLACSQVCVSKLSDKTDKTFTKVQPFMLGSTFYPDTKYFFLQPTSSA